MLNYQCIGKIEALCYRYNTIIKTSKHCCVYCNEILIERLKMMESPGPSSDTNICEL